MTAASYSHRGWRACRMMRQGQLKLQYASLVTAQELSHKTTLLEAEIALQADPSGKGSGDGFVISL